MNKVYTVEQGGANRNHLIDIIKGVCILLVIITHYTWDEKQGNMLLFPFWLSMAVPVFMIISGYVSAMSLSRNKICSFADYFSINNILSKCARYTIPYCIAFIIELLIESFVLKRYTLNNYVSIFFTGGIGPGSYYFPLMIQFVFLFPFVYMSIRKSGVHGVLIFFILNFCFEFFQRIFGLTEACYRLLIFRYVFIIAFGCYIYVKKDERIKSVWLIISFLLGILFIILFEYTSYSPKVIVYWKRTSFVACLYTISILYIVLRKESSIHFIPLELLGKASFNIFLAQMVYYAYATGVVYKYISVGVARIFVNVLVCCCFGVLFYMIETPVSRLIVKKINSYHFNLADKVSNCFIATE